MCTLSSTGGNVQQGILPGVPNQQAAQRAGRAWGADWEVQNYLILQMYGAAKLYVSLSGTRVTLTPEATPGNC